MSNLSLAAGRPTLADRFFSRSLATDAVLITAGAALTAGAAQIAIPMWPVPITGQTFAVLLVGTVLGAARGGLALGLYAVLGLVGLPIFTSGTSGWAVVAGPTGGYIVGFILAAILVGWLAQLKWDRRVLKTFASFVLGTITIYAVGLPWLGFWLAGHGFPHDLQTVLSQGLYPFIPGDILKALVAAGLLPLIWKLSKRSSRSDKI